MKYDYHDDKEIALAAEKYDKVCGGKSYDDLVNDPDSVPVLFYDTEILSEYFSETEGVSDVPLLSGMQQFSIGMGTLFSNYYTMEYKSSDDMEYAAKGLIMALFQTYSEKLEQHFEKSFEDVASWVRKWRDVSLDIIKEVYESCPESIGIMGGHLDVLRIVRQTMWTAECVCSEFLESRKYGKLQYASDVVPYNFWGYKYSEMYSSARSEVRSSEENGAVIDVLNNKLYLAKRYRDSMDRIVAVADDVDKANGVIEEVCDEFKTLFSEYTKLLHLRGLSSHKMLSAAAQHWKDITATSVDVETFLYGQPFRLIDYHPGDIIHPEVFRSSELGKWEAIHALKKQLLNVINGDIQLYVDGLKGNPVSYEWTDSLDKLKIKYVKLYKAMIALRYFDSSLSYDVFCDAIKRADVSAIQDALINPIRNTSALRCLVRTIGHEVDSWYAAAATTLKDSKGNPYTRDKLDKVSNMSDAFVEMTDILPELMKLTDKRAW